MRRFLTVGCCALYLVFGFVAGLAHVHESAGHHEETRGLHLDHGHLGKSHAPSDHHEHHHDQAHESGPTRPTGVRHVDHHDGDAVYLNATAARSLDSGVRLIPAVAAVATVIDPPSPASNHDDTVTAQPRDPPGKTTPRERAPPA